MTGIMVFSLIWCGCLPGPPGDASIPVGAGPAVEQAKEDLAARRGIDKEKIRVVSVEAVDWPDTSLGCPEPGMMYAQVITPGYRIILSFSKEVHVYHSDRGKRVIYCGRPS